MRTVDGGEQKGRPSGDAHGAAQTRCARLCGPNGGPEALGERPSSGRRTQGGSVGPRVARVAGLASGEKDGALRAAATSSKRAVGFRCCLPISERGSDTGYCIPHGYASVPHMPSLELQLDTNHYRLDSPDREICGRWLGDLLTMWPITPATLVVLRVRPFYVPNPENRWMGQGVPDWEADWQRWHSVSADSPADAARQLAARLSAVADSLDAG